LNKFTIILILINLSCTTNTISKIIAPILDSATTIAKNKSDSIEFTFTDTSFENFYTRFISDSVFQITNVHCPLEGNYSDYDKTKKWTKEEWSFIELDFRDALNNSDDSLSIVQNDLEFFFGSYCRDCGFSFEMRFEKMDGSWKMTRRQENNY